MKSTKVRRPPQALYINLIARIAYEQRTGIAPVPWLDRPSLLAIAV